MVRTEILFEGISFKGGRKLLVDPELSERGVIDAYRFSDEVGGVKTRRIVAMRKFNLGIGYEVALIIKRVANGENACTTRRLIAEVIAEKIPEEGWSLSLRPQTELLARLSKTSVRAHSM